MKRLLLMCALMLAACGPKGGATTSSDVHTLAAAAPARIEELKADAAGAQCTTDGVWCATTDADATTFVFSYQHKQVAVFHLTDGGHEIWSRIVRTPRADGGEDALVGISHSDEQGYSGGGGQATLVSLYATASSASAAAAHPALVFPAYAALDIRACFSPADERMRRGACSDQYNFTGTLSLDASATPAKLVLVTEATTYPAGIRRNEDNTRALSARDLRTARDPNCSYHRVFTWDAASQTYKPDAPLPACSDYLEP